MMRNIFELTKQEQRVVIVIVTLLVAVAFLKHAWQNKSDPPLKTSTPEATAQPQDDSRDQLPDKSGKRP